MTTTGTQVSYFSCSSESESMSIFCGLRPWRRSSDSASSQRWQPVRVKRRTRGITVFSVQIADGGRLVDLITAGGPRRLAETGTNCRGGGGDFPEFVK